MDRASNSPVVLEETFDIELNDVLVEAWSNGGRSDAVDARVILESEVEGADLVTVVTLPNPLDFTTASSFVLSSTRSCIGIGF
jgi:hypothetical protein